MGSKRGIRSLARRALHSTALIGASLGGIAPGHALAQDVATNDQVASGGYTLTVYGERQSDVPSPKYTAPLLDTPQTITIIDDEDIKQQNLLGLENILSTVPGITFGAGEGGGGYGDKINLRGYDATNDITVDGVRDSALYSRSDPFDLDQVEVVNGANSAYSGAGSVGGTINLVTKRPNASNKTALSLAGGTDDYERVTVDADRMISDDIAVRLNAVAHHNDVPGRDVEYYKRWGVAPAITFGVGTPTEVTLLYTHQQDDNIPLYGVPYALNAFNNGPLPGVNKSDYFGYRNIDKQNIDVDSFTVLLEHKIKDWLSLRNLTRWEEVDQFSIVDMPQGSYCLDTAIDPFTGLACAAPGTYAPSGPRGTLRDTSNEELVNQTDFTAKFATFGLQHAADFGFSFSDENYHLSQGDVERNPLGATPNPVLPVMDLSNPYSIYSGPYNRIDTSLTDSEVRNEAVYLFDNIDLTQRWSLNAGVRFESNRGKATGATVDVPYPPPPATPVVEQSPVADNNDDLLSYRAGIVYKPVSEASLYFAYGNSQTPSQSTVDGSCTLVPTTRTGSNCNLAPEKAQSFEVGAKWNALGGRLLLTASAFRNERTNFRVNSGDPLVPEQQLDGKSRVDGIAVGASGHITDRWSILANYTYLHSEILRSISDLAISGGMLDFEAGDPLPNTPENSGSLWTTYLLPYKVTVGYGVTYSGRYTFARASQTSLLYYAPGYWVHNLMVSYPIKDDLALQLNVNNVLDKTYYTNIRNNATSGWATPGNARNAVLSLNYRF